MGREAGDDLIGTAIGPYEIERRIGAGGMGRVYLARQPAIGARVAIKVVGDDGDGDLADRLFAEARAVNLINHECIVNIVDMVQLADGRPALVMEYLTGAPLDELIRARELPLDSVGEIVLDVLSAIGAAHERHILHRDLKPANVLVTPRGRAKVLDFGIAKSMSGVNPASTGAGKVVGTPAYMSPEQARGMPVDERSDLFSVGLILYEALTGQRAYQAASLGEVVNAHLQPIEPPSAVVGELDPALDKVVMRALAPLPDLRFESAPAMAAALREAIGPSASASLVLMKAIRDTARQLERPWEAGNRDGKPEPESGETSDGGTGDSDVEPEPTGPTRLERPPPTEPPPPRSLWPIAAGAAVLAITAGIGLAIALLSDDPEPSGARQPVASRAPVQRLTGHDRFLRARDAARQLRPGAQLFAASGVLDRERGKLVEVRYRFYAPSPEAGNCVVDVVANMPIPGMHIGGIADCPSLQPTELRCTPEQIAARFLETHPGAGLTSFTRGPGDWSFDLEVMTDDCDRADRELEVLDHPADHGGCTPSPGGRYCMFAP